MDRTVRLLCAACLLVFVLAPTATSAPEMGRYMFDPEGRVEAVRVVDVNGDGRKDLVLLLGRTGEGGRRHQEILVLRTPATPAAGTFFAPAHQSRIALDEGPLAAAGAVAVGRFGPDGSVRLRFLGADGATDVKPDGTPAARHTDHPTLLARSPGRSLVFWDGHGDLDGDGRDECWFPSAEGNGPIQVLGGTPAQTRRLALAATNSGGSDANHLMVRYAYVPVLAMADLDGDGRRELVAFREDTLVAWPGAAAAEDPRHPVAPTYRLPLPFRKKDLAPEEIHTPRLQLADVDADGITDLLVTLVTGRRDQLGSLRTRLLHFPGPFRDPETGTLVAPRVRIDTESVALHPRFVDLNGDGTLDYVIDAVRGTKVDMLRRVLGQEPTIWIVGFRFDRTRGTFEEAPYFSAERPYAREEAMSNRFGITGWLDGDFNGDGHKDLLDLGNLKGLEILGAVPKQGRGPGDPVAFSDRLMQRARVPSTLTADAVVADLTGDGRADAVLWSEATLFLIVPGGDR